MIAHQYRLRGATARGCDETPSARRDAGVHRHSQRTLRLPLAVTSSKDRASLVAQAKCIALATGPLHSGS